MCRRSFPMRGVIDEECRLKRGGVVDDAVEHLCVAMAKA